MHTSIQKRNNTPFQAIPSRLANGFSDQRGALFGFGPHQDEDTGKLLKISEFIKDDANRLKRNKAQVHNLNEERSVGFINYELATRGKNHIEAASKKNGY